MEMDEDYASKKENSDCVMLICDRSIDVMAPLLHEFTYQAMMNDLLNMNEGKYSMKMDAIDSSSSGTQKQATATVDENDAIYLQLRHWHYADAVEYIKDAFNKFLSTNRAASAALTNQDTQGIDSINNMKETLSALPEFQEMKTKVI